MKLALMADEVTSDLETALELACEWGVDGIELRGIGNDRYPMVGPLERARVPELLAEWKLPVAAISPGLFKISFPSPAPRETRILRWEDAAFFARERAAEDLVRRHVEEILPASIAAAKAIGAPTIVCFSFDRPPDGHANHGPVTAPAPDAVIDILRAAARAVEAAGLTLALEVEHICWGDTARHAAAIVERVGSPAFGINWDPANAFRAGESDAFPAGYAAVRGMVRHVHYKQASVLPDGSRRFTPEGEIDWRGQVRALADDGYSGWITVEPHVAPKVAGARRAVTQLKTLMEEL